MATPKDIEASPPPNIGNSSKFREWFTYGIAVSVTFVWAATFLADIFLGEKYSPPSEVHIGFMAVIGLVLGIDPVLKKKG